MTRPGAWTQVYKSRSPFMRSVVQWYRPRFSCRSLGFESRCRLAFFFIYIYIYVYIPLDRWSSGRVVAFGLDDRGSVPARIPKLLTLRIIINYIKIINFSLPGRFCFILCIYYFLQKQSLSFKKNYQISSCKTFSYQRVSANLKKLIVISLRAWK